MERLNYTPDELREAFRYLREQGGQHLFQMHAANWRTKFTIFMDAMMKNQEALRLIVRLFDGHTRVSAKEWYKAAADRRTPPLPSDRYERLALVWQLISKAMPKSNPDGFDKNEKIDLPYVLVNSDIEGGSMGERLIEFRLRYIEPFVHELNAAGEDLLAAIPLGASSVDLWDAALAAFAKPAVAPAPGPGALARAIAEEEAAARAKAEGREPPPPAAQEGASLEGAGEAPREEAAPAPKRKAAAKGKAAPKAKATPESKAASKAKAAPKAAKAPAKKKAKGVPAKEVEAPAKAAAPAPVAPAPKPVKAPAPQPADDERDTSRIRDMARKAKEKAARARRT